MKQRSLASRIFRRLFFATAAIVLTIAAWYVWPVDLVKPHFTVSKETTWFTVPVDAEGYVDYQIALNEQASQGVTPENNAMVLLLQAIGAKADKSGSLNPEYFKRFGVPEPPQDGDYLITLSQMAKEGDWAELSNIDILDEWHDFTTKRTWKSEQYPRAMEWLEKNRKPLELIEQASRRSHYYSPMVFPASVKPHEQSLMGMLLPFVQKCRDCANLLVARAMLRMGRKQYQEAWNDLMTMMRLGRLMMKGATLIESLVGMAIQNLASDACIILLDQPDLTLKFLRQCHRDWDAFSEFDALAAALNSGERAVMLDVFLMFNRHGPGMVHAMGGGKIEKSANHVVNSWRNAEWDAPLKRINAWFDRLTMIVSERNRDKRRMMEQEFMVEMFEKRSRVDEERQSWMRFVEPATKTVNRQAEIIMVLLTPAFNKVRLAYDKTEQRRQLTSVALAISIYHVEKKVYPEKLSELSPGYLKAIPQDLFSDHPLIYRRTTSGYLLYSVGQNGIDDDGKSSGGALSGDDIVVEIPVPPLAKKEG